MKRSRLPTTVVALLVLASLACQLTTVLPTPTQPATPAAEASATPPPQATSTRTPQGATPQPSPSVAPTRAPRPSPTSVMAPTQTPGHYYNDVLGVRLEYPPEWTAEENPDQGLLLRLDSDNGNIIGLLLEPTPGSGETLEDTAGALVTAVGGTGATVKSSKPVSTTGGLPAFELVFEPQTNSANPFRVKLLVAERGGRYFAVALGVPADAWDDELKAVDQVAYSLSLEEPKPYGISREHSLVLEGGEPLTLDPARTLSGAGDYSGLIFSGLVALDTGMQVAPDLAQSWDLSADGRTYTFHLRHGVTFHDGKAFTAADVKYSIERAADPETKSNTVQTYLSDIVGLQDRLEGKAQDVSGVVVVDDYTVAITIDQPKAYFLAKLTYPVSWVVDRDNVESGDDWQEHPNGTGPFMLTRWEHDKLMIFGRNESYYRGAPKLENVMYLLYSGQSLNMYEVGDIDITGVGGQSLERVQDPKEPMNKDLVSAPSFCTTRIVFDVTQKPFDDENVRKAFVMAVDREKIMKTALGSNVTLANGILPPGLPGYSADIKPLPFDADAARQALADSSYKVAANLPEITYTMRGLGGPPSDITSAVIEMWEKTLGVKIKIEQIDPENYEDALYGKHGHIVDYGWCADYPDPENFLDLLYHTGQKTNVGHYDNPEVDRLLEQARSERDWNKRQQLYHQIEQIEVDDAGAIPMWNYTQYALVKPYVKGYVLTPIEVPQLQFVSIQR